jgi:hypothetical protein
MMVDTTVEDSLNPILVVGGEQGHHTLVPVPLPKAKEKERANLNPDATKANLPTAPPQATAHRPMTLPTNAKKPVDIVVAITLPATAGNGRMRIRRLGS